MLISRSVVRRKKNGRDLKGILRMTREPLAQALNDYFASIRREGQPTTDYAGILSDLGNAIDVDFDQLQIADWAHLAETANDRRLRREREDATEVVHRTLVNITATVDGSHGDGIAEELLGLGTGLRKEPELMLEAASHAAVLLADPDFRFPELVLGGVELDTGELLTQITGPLARLEQVLGRLTDEEKKSIATLEVKELAIARYDKTYSRDANILKALLGFAGMDKQAERIRPKARRRKAADDEPPASGPPGSEAPGSGLPEDDPIFEIDDNGDPVAVVDPEALPERVNAENGATPTEKPSA